MVLLITFALLPLIFYLSGYLSGEALPELNVEWLLNELFESMITSVVLGIGAGILVSRSLSKPVAQLVATTQKIGPTNLSQRVEVKGIKELEELAVSFNKMLADLERTQQQRRNLLADVSHELLTPLTILEGNLRAILDGVYEMNKEEISHLYDQTHHLIRLVKDLRQLAQAEAKQLPLMISEGDIELLIEDTMTLFEPLANEKQLTLRSILPDSLPPVSFDHGRLRQVLNNLLSNALRHTPNGGSITIRVAQQANEISIAVEDTGEGLQPDEVAQIFERFYRVDPSRSRASGGSGIGLAISRQLARLMDGDITAESEGKDMGSTFTLYLPAV